MESSSRSNGTENSTRIARGVFKGGQEKRSFTSSGNSAAAAVRDLQRCCCLSPCAMPKDYEETDQSLPSPRIGMMKKSHSRICANTSSTLKKRTLFFLTSAGVEYPMSSDEFSNDRPSSHTKNPWNVGLIGPRCWACLGGFFSF